MAFLASTKCDSAFDEEEDIFGENKSNGGKGDKIDKNAPVHVWIKQRTGRKYITEIEGLAEDLNLKKIAKYMRHDFKCSVAKVTKELGENKKVNILRIQGDKRDEVVSFLHDENIIDKKYIKVHGF